MKILSTFGDVDVDNSIMIRGVSCSTKSRPHTEIYAEDTPGGFYFKDIPPGESFRLEAVLDIGDENPERIVVNWFCNATKTRGALFNVSERTFQGEIPEKRVRGSLQLTPQILDDQGRILSSGIRSVIWLEGRHAYFPTISIPMKSPMAHTFVYLEYDTTAEPDAIFSKDTVQAVYNSASKFCDNVTGFPYGGTLSQFSLYEVWRQFIEVILNNEDITNFDFGVDSDDSRIIVIVSRVVAEIFPASNFSEIKNLRQRDYPKFCSQVQSYFFERCK